MRFQAMLLSNKQLRTLPYVAQHLRTFKVGLFKKIRKEDLMLNGKFYEVNADMAVMIPLLEMAGPTHSKFIQIFCMSIIIQTLLAII